MDLLKTDELNVDNSTQMYYLDKLTVLFDTYTSLKKIIKYKLKLKVKP